MVAKIPVFVSAPSKLSDDQQVSYDFILDRLRKENFERRALGRSDYPSDYPLKEIVLISRHCAGAIILGYNQISATKALLKPGTDEEKEIEDLKVPTPWNQLEAGILFSMKLPLLVFREAGVTGGIFDTGTSDRFINKLPLGSELQPAKAQIIATMQNWAAEVRTKYRNW